MMEGHVDERVEAYLDGMLTARETRAFERELASQPELSRALAAALLVRDLLASMPPEQAPPGLEKRIERLLEIDAPSKDASREPMWPRLRAALDGATLGLRGPVWALESQRTVGSSAMVGLAQVRWALGPLAGAALRESADGASHKVHAPPKQKPLWRRAVALVWR